MWQRRRKVLLFSSDFFVKPEPSRQTWDKYSNIELRANPSSGSRVIPLGHTDRHDETNGRFAQFVHAF